MATRLLEEGRATLLGDFRTPAAVSRALGMQTGNAAVFVRADRRPAAVHLAAFAQALLAAQERLRAASAEELAAPPPSRGAGAHAECQARPAPARARPLPARLA